MAFEGQDDGSTDGQTSQERTDETLGSRGKNSDPPRPVINAFHKRCRFRQKVSENVSNFFVSFLALGHPARKNDDSPNMAISVPSGKGGLMLCWFTACVSGTERGVSRPANKETPSLADELTAEMKESTHKTNVRSGNILI